MKKLVPYLSLLCLAVSLIQCSGRDENADENYKPQGISKRGDTASTINPIVDPDPPVRDGDNWRNSQNN